MYERILPFVALDKSCREIPGVENSHDIHILMHKVLSLSGIHATRSPCPPLVALEQWILAIEYILYGSMMMQGGDS